MCGIAGFCNFTGDIEKNIAAMCEALRHRGPDAGGVWLSADRTVVLGHRRLRIIDLTETGAQPMPSASGRYVITFNGEIYNYQKIAEKLQREKKVASFRGTSDTEVLLEAIEAYGLKETLALCKGMFAFALYDTQERTLYLARDRVGEKPLYYGRVGGAFVFASELGALTALAGFDNAINTDVLSLYFIHGYVPAPYSIYQDIYKLEAGTFLTIAPPYREGRAETYWSIKEVA
ncbi:MAG: asparagine synthetase B, partial [Lachnospiraceae bacterium]|nr:asparagine synthetase B [Lachnospiraceae bacterium]